MKTDISRSERLISVVILLFVFFLAHPISKEARELLNSKVMEAYNQALDEQQSEDESESFTQKM